MSARAAFCAASTRGARSAAALAAAAWAAATRGDRGRGLAGRLHARARARRGPPRPAGAMVSRADATGGAAAATAAATFGATAATWRRLLGGVERGAGCLAGGRDPWTELLGREAAGLGGRHPDVGEALLELGADDLTARLLAEHELHLRVDRLAIILPGPAGEHTPSGHDERSGAAG